VPQVAAEFVMACSEILPLNADALAPAGGKTPTKPQDD
jgi:hypothetical protein